MYGFWSSLEGGENVTCEGVFTGICRTNRRRKKTVEEVVVKLNDSMLAGKLGQL